MNIEQHGLPELPDRSEQTEQTELIISDNHEPLIVRQVGERPLKQKIIIAAVLAVIAVFSIVVLGTFASSSETYSGIVSTLDEKKNNVIGLAATTTGASAAISALPGDTGTPIADQLVDFSSYLMVILAVIYLEKFLITLLGGAAFFVLVPVGLVLFAVAVFTRPGSLSKVNLQKLGTKLVTFGVALALVVPASVMLTDNIDATYADTLAASQAAAEEATQQLEESAQQQEQQEDAGFFGNIVGAVQSGIESVTQGAQDALDTLGDQLNIMIDTIAVMIVTSCLIPLLVLIVFLQLVKIITGLDFGGATYVLNSARAKGRSVAKSLKGGSPRHS